MVIFTDKVLPVLCEENFGFHNVIETLLIVLNNTQFQRLGNKIPAANTVQKVVNTIIIIMVY